MSKKRTRGAFGRSNLNRMVAEAASLVDAELVAAGFTALNDGAHFYYRHERAGWNRKLSPEAAKELAKQWANEGEGAA